MAYEPIALNFDIGKEVRKAIKNAFDEHRKETLSVSGLSACPRKTYRHIKDGMPEEYEDKSLWALFAGTALHEAILHVLYKKRGALSIVYKKGEKKVAVEVPGFPKLFGHADFLCSKDKVVAVVDFKTVNNYVFDMIKVMDQPKDDHIGQVSLYAKAVGADVCIVLYIERGTGKMLPFPFKRDDETADRLIEKYKEIVDAKVVPAKYPAPQKACGYCQFYGECFGFLGLKKNVEKVVNLDELNPALAQELLEAKYLKKQFEERENEIKFEFAEILQGKKGVSEYFSMSLVEASEQEEYDEDKLAELVDANILKNCIVKKPKNGFYGVYPNKEGKKLAENLRQERLSAKPIPKAS